MLRLASLLPYTRYLYSMGAPVGRLLENARIPAGLLNHPAAAVHLENALRFGELACWSQGTEHIGLYVGLETSLDDIGPYGQILQNALTVHDYLRKGISLHNLTVTGQRIWLSEHGEELRLNWATIGESRLGAYQSHIENLAITISKLREAAGPHWSPRKISLAYRTQEDLPDIDLFAGTQVLRGTGETYFTLPRAMMGLRFPVRSGMRTRDRESPVERPLPENLTDLVQLQIGALLSDRLLHVDIVAETLAMSTRSLQRELAKQGLTYSQLLVETRLRQASRWLESTDKSVAEIAFDLGYTDASNFTRAFGRQIGVSPQIFRENAKQT